jgi:hypothetical protein
MFPMALRPVWAAVFVENLEERIAEIRLLHLEPLESGRLKILESGIDITQSEIASLRQNIASIEAVIAQYRDME